MNENGIDFDSKFIPGDFDRFREYFNASELACLRGLDLKRSSDSTFLKCAVEFLHKDNLASLVNKTVTGQVKQVSEGGAVKLLTIKECISPLKVEIVKELFNERISVLSFESGPDRRKKRFHSVLAKVVDRLRVDRLKSPRVKRKLDFHENC